MTQFLTCYCIVSYVKNNDSLSELSYKIHNIVESFTTGKKIHDCF